MLRCDTVIEPLISKQWFLKMKDLAKAKAEVENGNIKFHPENSVKTYLGTVIFRLVYFAPALVGHKIPLDGADDVLDTWFSSALWPFATLLGGPERSRGARLSFYPTQVLLQLAIL